jgi:hypothetical protein
MSSNLLFLKSKKENPIRFRENMKRRAPYLKLLFILAIFPIIIEAQNENLLSETVRFQKAAGFSINEAKAIFVLDKGTNEVIKLDSAGTVIKKIGGTGWDDYTFDNPADICATMLKVYITDRNNNRIQVYDKDLNFLFSLDPKNFAPDKGIFKYPVSSQASHLGDIYIADSDNKQILKFNANWEYVNSFGNYDYGKFAMADPVKLAIDNNSNLYLLDGRRIILYDQYGNGIFTFQLAERGSSIRITNNLAVIACDNYLLISRIGDNPESAFRFEKIIPSTKEHIVDALASGGKIYLLTENSILIYNLPPFEKNN